MTVRRAGARGAGRLYMSKSVRLYSIPAFVFIAVCCSYAQQPADTSHLTVSPGDTLPLRQPVPLGTFMPPKYHSLYHNPSDSSLRFGASLDTSNTNGININAGPESNGIPLNQYYNVPLDVYLFDEKALVQRSIWEQMSRQYVLGARPDEITRLLNRYTNITLPVNAPAFTTLFGKPEINIGVTGSADVHLSVISTYTNLTGLSALGSTQTAPAFSQDLAVNVNGKIGDKLVMTADWNTTRTFDYENQLKVAYTGYDDEIIQSIEAGNVTLQTPSKLITGSQALFGLKAKMQFGPLYLTAIAAQKKGESKTITLGGNNGGGAGGYTVLNATQYSQDHYMLDWIYEQWYHSEYGGTTLQTQTQEFPYYPNQLTVWVSTNNLLDPTVRFGLATDTLSPVLVSSNSGYKLSNYVNSIGQTPPQGSAYIGRWKQLVQTTANKPGNYVYNPNTGELTITNLGQGSFSTEAIAVSYQINGPDGKAGTADDKVYGTGLSSANGANPNDTLLLKLIRPINLLPSDKTWTLLMKNIYPVGATSVSANGLGVTVTYRYPDGDSTQNSHFSGPTGPNEQWVTVLGLDKTNPNGGLTPDGIFDPLLGSTNTAVNFDTTLGEVIFPYLEPFATQTLINLFPQQQAFADSVGFDKLYDTSYQAAYNDGQHNRFLINITYQGGSSNVISLNAFNIAPGSVHVYLSGNLLTQGVDYTEDDIAGKVTLINPQAIQQISNVTIQFEQNDVFTTATRTLLGLRGDLMISKNIKLGFTLFNYNQQIITDKVLIGEEPISNWIGGIDGSATIPLPFVSKALSILPFFNSRDKTTLTLSGEIAYVMPQNNSNNSGVNCDGNQGTAMIDDFEGARYAIPLDGSYGFWHFAAPPVVNINNNGLTIWDDSSHASDSMKIHDKGLFYWYNIIPSDVLTTQIWPQESVSEANATTTVLNFSYNPFRRGIYNNQPYLLNQGANPDSVWGGVTRAIYANSGPIDLTQQNVANLEVWVQINSPIPLPPSARMYFDLGLISEGVIPNGQLMTEDGITPDHQTPTGVLYPDEDVGIDSIPDAVEQVRYANYVNAYKGYYPDMVADPNGDDWYYTTGSSDYTHVNGMEGNGASEFGRTPDSEDLNGNNTLDATNAYFEYKINLDTTVNNPQRVGAGTLGWTELRIPLQKYTRAVGSPSLQNVNFARIWVAGFNDSVTFRFAEIALVGSRWVAQPVDTSGTLDSNFTVSFVDIQDNSGAPNYYTTPPCVQRVVNPYITTQVVYENEQSLALNVCDLPKGQSREAFQYEQGTNLFNYNDLGFFIHGDNSMLNGGDSSLSKDEKAEFFIRFGTDTADYYEYREPITVGWDNIMLNLDTLTAIKNARDSQQVFQYYSRPWPGPGHPVGATYAVEGQPTATRVMFFSLGVTNPRAKGPPGTLCTSVWIDELRVIGAHTKNDWAAIVNGGLTLGSLGQIQASASQTNPDFHSMDTRFGDQTEHQSWSFSAQTALEHFLKFYSGLSVPFVYSHTETLQNPRYIPQSDIGVAGEEALKPDSASYIHMSAQTLSVNNSYSLSGIKIPIPVKFWLIEDTWNRLGYSFTYSNSFTRTPFIQYQNSWNWNASVTYGVQLKQFLTVEPFASLASVPAVGDYKTYKIFLMPSSFNAGLSISRSEVDEQDRGVDSVNPKVLAFSAVRSAGFAWPFSINGLLNPTFTYNLSITSTLVPLELADSATDSLYSFSQILRTMFFSNGELFNLGEDNALTQTVQVTMHPKVPKIFALDRFVDLQSSYNVAYNWSNTLTQLDVGKSSGWTSNLQVGANVKLKLLTENWLGPEHAAQGDTSKEFTIKDLFRDAFRIPFLDYDAVNITYTQTNTVHNQGVQGGTGIDNFWRPEQDLAAGPNRLYQLGLITAPDGDLGIQFGNGFPFVHFTSDMGRRAIDATLTDNFQQSNTLELRTTRELWKGATLTLNWKSAWNYNNNMTLVTDSLGVPSIQSNVATLNITRSFFSVPPIFGFSLFNNTVTRVEALYNADKARIGATPNIDTTTRNVLQSEALANDFESGFEALSFLPRVVQEYLPRVNWTFRWDGLEKLPFFESYAQHVTIENAYASTYTRSLQTDPNGGGMSTQGQTLTIGFQPLIAINMTLKEKVVGGNLSGQARFNTSTTWTNQGAASGTIERDVTTDISVTATYSRPGLKFPFFGLNLKNDLEASFTFTSSATSSRTWDVDDFNADGTPLNGSTTITMEPRITYTISQRVRGSIFYQIQRTIPDPNGSTTPATSTVSAGIDIHITISGGQ